MDGASEMGIYFRISMPLSWPAMLTLALLTWRETWDAFVWPRTVPLGLHRFQEEYVTNYNEVMAIASIAMVPMLLLFLVFQRAFVRGIMVSGLKG